MTADTLRIILLILGVLLVAGIYLYDRYQDRPRRPERDTRRRERRTPVLSEPAQASGDAASTASVAAHPQASPAVPPATDEPTEATPPSGENWQLPLEDEPNLSPDMNFSAHEGTDYLHQVEGVDDGLPKMILQINVIARDGQFEGERLDAACRQAGLVAGELDIYHCFDQRRPDMVLFSVANLVEPGSFPLQQMAGFETPGMALFTQLPGVIDGIAVYSRMVSVAENLATLLNAELQDDSGSTLSRQCIERTKESIVDYQRELALARRRA